MPQQQLLASPVIPLALMFLVFYFLLIRPQKKQEKDRHNMINSLDKNDQVVTTGGIHGTVVNVKDKTLILRIDDNVKMEVEKNCVAYKKKSPDTSEVKK
jgi:preprotein translocase subunit YajC